MAFKLRSGNTTNFKSMGSSPAKDMKTGSYEHSFESPAKQKLNKGGEGQDQDKIFNNKGEHIGDYVNDKPVMKPGFKRPVVKKDAPVKPKEGDMKKYSDLEKYDDDNPTGKPKPPKKKGISKKIRETILKSPDTRKDKLYKKSSDKPVKPTDEDMKKYSDLEKYDDDNPTGKAKPPKKKKSPAKQAKQKGLGPRTAFGGVKNPELVKTKKTKSKKVMKDGPKKQVTGVKNPGNWQPHPNTFKAKKSTVSKHGQLDDAEIEYQNDLKLLKKMNSSKKKK